MVNRTDIKESPGISEWPNTVRNRSELDKALEDGEKSGATHESIMEIANQTLTRLKNG